MTTNSLILAAVDLAAALVLVLGIYYRRHRRRDLVVAFLGVNVGVLAVATVLGTAEIALGLGLGLFGVLSIIRLRSSEISQREVAYYFASLAMGLIGGLASADPLLPTLLIALILVVMWGRITRPCSAAAATRWCVWNGQSPMRRSCGTNSRPGSARPSQRSRCSSSTS